MHTYIIYNVKVVLFAILAGMYALCSCLVWCHMLLVWLGKEIRWVGCQKGIFCVHVDQTDGDKGAVLDSDHCILPSLGTWCLRLERPCSSSCPCRRRIGFGWSVRAWLGNHTCTTSRRRWTDEKKDSKGTRVRCNQTHVIYITRNLCANWAWSNLKSNKFQTHNKY